MQADQIDASMSSPKVTPDSHPSAVEQIWVENFKESVRQLQVYLLSGIVASASYFSIGIHWSLVGGSPDANVPGLYFGLDTDSGLFVVWLIYFFFGWAVNHAAYCAIRSIRALTGQPEIVGALFGHPSLALAQPSASFLICGPAVLVCWGMLVITGHIPGPHPLLSSKLVIFFTASPYLTTVMMVWSLFITKRTIISKSGSNNT